MKAILALTIAGLLLVSTFAVPLPICPPKNSEFVTLIENPNDCSTYFSCNDGNLYLMRCYEGLLFNPLLKVCDWPENVICGSPSTPEPEVTTPEPEVSGSVTEDSEIIEKSV